MADSGCKKCHDNCCHINVRIALAVLGVIAGLAAGACFFAVFSNLNAGAWAIISAIFAGITLWIHIDYKRGILAAVSDAALKWLMLLGCVGQLAGVCSLCVYIVLAILLPHQDFHSGVHGEKFGIAVVWSYMTWKWGFSLFWFARKYRREFAQSLTINASDDEEAHVIAKAESP